MKKNIVFLGTLLICGLSYSQVGINTNTPQVTLDVVGEPTNTSTLDGILLPRMTGDQMASKTYTMAQRGAIAYATSAASTLAGQVINVYKEGLYFFNGTLWEAGPQGRPGTDGLDGTPGPSIHYVLNATTNGGLVRAGAGINGNEYTLGLTSGTANGQVMTWNGTQWNPAASTNIYNADGTLTSTRTLTQSGNTLTFNNTQKTLFSNSAGIGIQQDSGSGTRANITLSNGGVPQLYMWTDTNSAAQILAEGSSTSLILGSRYTANPAPIMFQTSTGNNSVGLTRMIITGAGNVGIGTGSPNANTRLHVVKTASDLTPAIIVGCQTYTDNNAATTAGLPVGALYRKADGTLMVRY